MNLVYIAGPYSADPVGGLRAAIDARCALLDAGIASIVPHETLLDQLVWPRSYEHWLAMDFAILARCDAILRLYGDSPGADREVEEATRLGIPVFHTVSGVISWSRKTTTNT